MASNINNEGSLFVNNLRLETWYDNPLVLLLLILLQYDTSRLSEEI